LTETPNQKAASTELTGGAGFTYEDTIVAYFLAHLVRHERAAAQSGFVTSVAVQQRGQGNPMDDLVIDFNDAGRTRSLGLQIKRSLTISGAPSNHDFRGIVAAARETQALASFTNGADRCGFIVEYVTPDSLRSMKRLIDWAKDSPTGAEFAVRFTASGTAAATETALRNDLLPIIGATNADEELAFYQNFTAFQLGGLEEGGALRTEIINRLQELVGENRDGIDLLLFDRLCRIARDGAAMGKRWTRAVLLEQLRNVVRLKVAPYFAYDVKRLNAYSVDSLNVVQEDVDGFHVERESLHQRVFDKLAKHRVVSIGGLPGCGKSAVLKRFALNSTVAGPVLFIKNDRIDASNWSAFAARLGLSNTDAVSLLQEIGSAGTPILFIDGIDRIRPDNQGVITDLVNKIVSEPSLSHWKVLVSSRDQGLEAFRAWFPTALYSETGIGDVSVKPFSDDEAKELAKSKPHLKSLLFGSQTVQDIARRPFFAAVLAHSIPEGTEPQTEVDLIEAWWARAGHDAHAETIPQRQRALIDIAEHGVGNLGKNISTRGLKDSTHAQIAALKGDHIIREERGGSLLTFAHDIFFEWAFLRLLIDLGDDWMKALEDAGEPPLLGRVVGLMAQQAVTERGKWTEAYRALEKKNLRRQWQREWLTAPPFTPAFGSAEEEFSALLKADNFALLEKVIVWFQAQHTIPSPIILGQIRSPVEGVDNLAIADMLGWPSDFRAWGRLIDWIIAEAATIPVRLIPTILDVFGVWQNVFSTILNSRSEAILTLANEWLLRFEEGKLRDAESSGSIDAFSRGEGSRVGTALRSILLRSAPSYSEFAKAIFKRAKADKDRRRKVFDDLISFSPIMSQVDPDLLADLAEAQLLEELPRDKNDRKRKEREEYYKRLAEIRAIPENDRTPNQQRMLDHVHFPIGEDRYDVDDIGIERHNNFYHPPSALHEPFKSLYENKPDVALRLTRNLSDHATEGWKQIHAIRQREMGTPISVVLECPWGKQEFWGDWRVYSWGQGQLAPTALECAFLALTYWAFKQVEGGRSASDVIKDIVEGNKCLAVLGIALDLALESWTTTDTTLALATCQRLWIYDRARHSQESSKNIDLLGYAWLSRLNGEKADAKAYLDGRKYRKRNVIQLATLFALHHDAALQAKFKNALAQFPTALPYELEEQKTDQSYTDHLKEEAAGWAGFGDRANYKQSQYDEERIAITYERPDPLTPRQEAKLAKSTTVLQGFNIVAWASQSISANKIDDGLTLDVAIAHVKGLDTNAAFDFRDDMAASLPSVAASVAACVIRFSAPDSEDRKWAWDVLARIEAMAENPETFSGSIIPWHPKRRLVVALFYDRQSEAPRADSVERLMKLALHPLNVVSELGLEALFSDTDEHVRWVAGQLALNLCTVQGGESKGNAWDHSANEKARADSIARALTALKDGTTGPMPKLPPAWTKGGTRRRRAMPDDLWHLPNPFFDSQTAAKLFAKMPLEAWMSSDAYRPHTEAMLFDLIAWSKESLLPSWRDKKKRSHSDDSRSDLHEWNAAFGDILARVAPFVALDVARNSLLAPFLVEDEEVLSVVASFADKLVCRHVFDAAVIPANALPLLDDCVTRVLNDRIFEPNGYRAGEVHGFSMPELINALLFVNVEKHCPGAARFANGNWSEIATIMPIIDRMVRNIGWSSFAMGRYIELHKRVSEAFPISAFGDQLNSAIVAINNAEEGWTGTVLPARLAAIVQRQADWNFPLQTEDAQALLKILDSLIDLGDRRSAALEQTEAFKGVQGSAKLKSA
jgi:hypothetical protein